MHTKSTRVRLGVAAANFALALAGCAMAPAPTKPSRPDGWATPG